MGHLHRLRAPVHQVEHEVPLRALEPHLLVAGSLGPLGLCALAAGAVAAVAGRQLTHAAVAAVQGEPRLAGRPEGRVG